MRCLMNDKSVKKVATPSDLYVLGRMTVGATEPRSEILLQGR